MKSIIFNNKIITEILKKQKSNLCCDPFMFELKDGHDYDKNPEKYSLGEYYTGHIETGACLYMRNKRQVWGVVSDVIKPKHKIGDILWVRESFGLQTRHGGEFLVYKADNPLLKNSDVGTNGGYETDAVKWKPAVCMSKKRARIFLQITDIRVEKLNDVRPEQTIINVDSKIAAKNPWVWVYSFKQLSECDVHDLL